MTNYFIFHAPHADAMTKAATSVKPMFPLQTPLFYQFEKV